MGMKNPPRMALPRLTAVLPPPHPLTSGMQSSGEKPGVTPATKSAFPWETGTGVRSSLCLPCFTEIQRLEELDALLEKIRNLANGGLARE
jgi:hypothetical protein